MMVTEHDLKGLMKFAERDEWSECFAVVLDAHFGLLFDEDSSDFEDLLEKIGFEWEGALWGCAFEDFLTLEFDIPGQNIVDEYLKRRGWREKPPAKAYMKAIRTSIMSLYEVRDVIPGKSMKLHDLLRQLEPVVISEFAATQSLKQWDKIAARVVHVRGQNIICGGLLPFAQKACEILFEGLNDVLELETAEDINSIHDEELQGVAAMFTLSWISSLIDGFAFQQNPEIFNSDNDAIEFHDIRFPFASKVTQKQIAAKLNAVAEFEQADSKFWNWLEKSNSKPQSQNAVTDMGRIWEVTMEDGSRVLGNIELSGKMLTVSVNSKTRAERSQTLIKQALGDLVRTPLIEIRTIQQMMDDAPVEERQAKQPEIPPDVAAQIMQDYLDKHYRKILDEPIPSLNNDTPRHAVKTKQGQKKVIEWLKYLENNTAKQANQDDPIGGYDFSWMWHELGLERPK